jgi:molecular chaperone HtpG
MSKQTLSFQAEVAQLLHLVTHSLYSNQEIFLRELISNASDACDKLRFEALNNNALYEDAPNLEVRVSFDKDAKTLTITDNGIGMSAQEAIDHLGTIAKSGTKDFMGKLTGDQKQDAQLIGQFGVGFYSGFIVADKITVESRRAGLKADEGVRWVSGGAGDFEVETITRARARHQRHPAPARRRLGIPQRLEAQAGDRQILRPHQPAHPDGKGRVEDGEGEKEGEPGGMVKTGEWETVNKASALWTRPKKDITEEQYQEFYKAISHDHENPLTWAHNRVEGNTEYTQLLYIPAKAPFDLWNRDKKAGVKLYVKRVFIMDDAEALMPGYLRFVKGVIDSSDLPLNVSRELLQESRDVRSIREGSTKRVLSMLEDLAKHDKHDTPARRRRRDRRGGRRQGQGRQVHPVLRRVRRRAEGRPGRRLRQPRAPGQAAALCQHHQRQRERGLCRLQGAHEGRPGGHLLHHRRHAWPPPRTARSSKSSRRRASRCCLMTDRVDEWALNYLHDFDGTPLQSVAKGAVDLGKLQDEAEKKAAEEAAEAFKPVLAKLKEALKDKAEDVRVTTRLVDSPACLVVQDDGMSTAARPHAQAGRPEGARDQARAGGERRAPAGEEARRQRALPRPGPHPVRPGPAGRRRPAGRPGGLRQAGECVAGVM